MLSLDDYGSFQIVEVDAVNVCGNTYFHCMRMYVLAAASPYDCWDCCEGCRP